MTTSRNSDLIYWISEPKRSFVIAAVASWALIAFLVLAPLKPGVESFVGRAVFALAGCYFLIRSLKGIQYGRRILVYEDRIEVADLGPSRTYALEDVETFDFGPAGEGNGPVVMVVSSGKRYTLPSVKDEHKTRDYLNSLLESLKSV